MFTGLSHRQIEAFRAVMICGTATGAAAFLNTSQPLISKLLDRLQSTTGLKLFNLYKGRLVPTAEARHLFTIVERSYIGLDQIHDSVSDLREGNTGKLTIGTLPSFGIGLLPQIIALFNKKYPDIRISIETANSDVLKHFVISGKTELGITLGNIDISGVLSESLVSLDAVCIMPISHPLADKDIVHVSDLQGIRFIAPTRVGALKREIDQILVSHKIKPVVVAETSYAITACMLVLQGMGVALVNPAILTDSVRRDLVAKPFSPALAIDLLLLRPENTAPSVIELNFVNELKSFFS